jgi:uncharacterized protein YndB with AHSA1/START domain
MRAQAEVDVAASVREVWAVLADVASWPTWNPAVRHAVCGSELEVGTRFRFSTEIGTLKCRVTAVDAPRRLSWKARVLVLGERQTWLLEPSPTGTHVHVEAEMTGLAARVWRRRLDERLQRVLDALVQLLRLEAEVRAAEGREDAARAAAMQGRG